MTELVTGVDIVGLQIRIAATGRLDRTQEDVTFDGCALECRLNAEDPRRGFAASPGRITTFDLPASADVRVDTHCSPGYFVPPYYDLLLAKVMVHASDRDSAIERMRATLAGATIGGVNTTLELSSWIVLSDDFRDVRISTRWLDEHLVDGSWPGPGARPASAVT